jgi:hypothetical protein
MGKSEQEAMELRFRKAAIGFSIGPTITAVRCASKAVSNSIRRLWKAIVQVNATRIFRPIINPKPRGGIPRQPPRWVGLNNQKVLNGVAQLGDTI